jgi:predicted 3-demethylubiquinone-9 3-methyltransferase (glyoxalase superfamily)
MLKITPHLWFDKEAREAAEFYTSIFENSKITSSSILHDTPSGDTEMVSFELSGYPFMGISAGPLFKFNPSISFHVKCKTTDEVDRIWNKLSSGGTELMKLDKYPFSERYGWVQDKYGLSWQVIHSTLPFTQKFTPVLMFTDKLAGRAEEAINFYVSIFKDSQINMISRYGKGMDPDSENSVSFAGFVLEGMEFGAMDSARDHNFNFNEAISFMVSCHNQSEIDYYWERLSADPKAEQCGWLKDKFGVSWQIVPTIMGEMIAKGTPEQIDRVTQAFLPMKKFDIEILQKAYAGK